MSKINKFWFAFKRLKLGLFFTSIILVSIVPVIYLLFYQKTMNMVNMSINSKLDIPVNTIFSYLSYIFGTLLVTQFCHYLSAVCFAKSASYFRNSIKSYLFEKLMTIKMRYIQTHDTAFLERQISEYPENFIHFCQVIIQSFIPFFIGGIMIVINGFIASVYIGLAYVLWATIVFGGIFLSIGYINKCQIDFTVSSGLQSDFVSENIRNFLVNKVFPHGFKMNMTKFMSYQGNANNLFYMFFTRVGLYRLIFGMINCIFFCMVIFFILNNNTKFNSVMSIGLVAQATKFISAIWDMITSSLPIVHYFGRINTYGAILDIFNEPKNMKNIDNINQILISKLNFNYEAKQVFKDFSCEINKCDRIWLKAPSGKGKSTFINIILGLLDVPRNSVFVNGVDINNINQESILSNVTVVTQNDFVFHDSILENVKRSNANLSDEDVNQLGSQFYLDKIGLPLSHECGYKGSKVSAGQAKVTCLTRALGKFYNNSTHSVVILDEPFVGCDHKIVDVLVNTFKNLQNITLIVCDHTDHAALITDKVIEL